MFKGKFNKIVKSDNCSIRGRNYIQRKIFN